MGSIGQRSATRSLWELLRETRAGSEVELTCDECFAIMEYLADCAVAGANEDELKAAVQAHLARCTGCEAVFAHRIAELETLLGGAVNDEKERL